MLQRTEESPMESSVRERYTAAAAEREAALCCPVSYDPQYLRAIPDAVIERDYGCGDPSRYVREGDVVLDLGSGGGKICFIAAQVVGPKGRVIGVDMNDEMLALARSAAPLVAERIGFANVEFHRGRIQDLELDLDRVDGWLRQHPVTDSAGLTALGDYCDGLRREPMIATGSVDVVVSNCVLNLVRAEDKPKLIREIYRVLRRGGRIAISDIVSDEPVPEELQRDAELWSGCISGAFHEEELLRELEAAGFYGIQISEWSQEPFRTVHGIVFRSITVTAHKGKDGPCYEANQAVIYRGPWKQVEDDDGHVLRRGERVAVCAKTFDILTRGPYGHDVLPIEPLTTIPEADRTLFDCSRTHKRHPRESKGLEYDATTDAAACCDPNTKCC
jgi:arsenite methyltransferase